MQLVDEKMAKAIRVQLKWKMSFDEVLEFIENRFKEFKSKKRLFIGGLTSKQRPGVGAESFYGKTLEYFFKKHAKYSYNDYIYLVAHRPDEDAAPKKVGIIKLHA